MSRILIIEDESDLQQILAYNLRQEGHEVLQALSGGTGLALARSSSPELVCLDLMLPDISGTEVCKLLKADTSTRSIPVLMLTAKGEERDRIRGFELGAEDYVVKPFSVRELMLRVQAILKRVSASTTTIPEEHITFGCLRIDTAAHRVWIHEQEVQLTTIEFRLLTTLYERKNRVQSRATLLEDVWGLQAETETRTVDTHIKRLREKLGAAEAYLETVRGVGYRFSDRPMEAH